MNIEAFSNVLGVVDDAITVAEEAIKAASKPVIAPAAETVTLVKVAHSKCAEAATALLRTGAFSSYSLPELTSQLETCGADGHLEIMEKLASTAVFPLSASDVLSGELVEKAAGSQDYSELSPANARWRKALDEAGSEVAG